MSLMHIDMHYSTTFITPFPTRFNARHNRDTHLKKLRVEEAKLGPEGAIQL
jgi:hypothetical protein